MIQESEKIELNPCFCGEQPKWWDDDIVHCVNPNCILFEQHFVEWDWNARHVSPQIEQLQARLARYEKMMEAVTLIHTRGYKYGISQREGKWYVWNEREGENYAKVFDSPLEAFDYLEKMK